LHCLTSFTSNTMQLSYNHDIFKILLQEKQAPASTFFLDFDITILYYYAKLRVVCASSGGCKDMKECTYI